MDIPWGRFELLGLVAVVALSGLAALLLFGDGRARVQPPDVAMLPYAEGLLTEIEDDRLVMRAFRPVDGRREITFSVRERDSGFVDVAHLRDHARDGIATRLWFDRRNGKYFAREDTDIPTPRSAR